MSLFKRPPKYLRKLPTFIPIPHYLKSRKYSVLYVCAIHNWRSRDRWNCPHQSESKHWRKNTSHPFVFTTWAGKYKSWPILYVYIILYCLLKMKEQEEQERGSSSVRVRSATNWISCIRVWCILIFVSEGFEPPDTFYNTIIITHKCIYWKIWVPSSGDRYIFVKRIGNYMIVKVWIKKLLTLVTHLVSRKLETRCVTRVCNFFIHTFTIM